MKSHIIERGQGTCTVIMQGDLTATVVPELQTTLKSELAQGAVEATFDLGKTRVVDSTGIGLLIACCNSLARAAGEIHVVNVSSDLMQLFKSMRLVSRLNAQEARS